jgi:hypothetical protein
MHQTKKGKQWYFGMKAQLGVDSKTKFIHRPVQRGEAKNVSYFPVPVRGTVSGRDIPATVTLTSPDLSPTPWGANLTPMVQLVPGANWLPEIGQVPLES